MLTVLAISLISAAAIIFFSRRLLRYLCHFQECGYDRQQFKNWLFENNIYDRKGSLIATISAIVLELVESRNLLISLVVCTIAAVALVWLALWENDPRKVGPVMLKTTAKATNIYNLALVLYSIALPLAIVCVYILGAKEDLACYWLVVIVAIQSSPLWLFFASTLLRNI
jgi:UDP-N-acetylmuramoyl-tripeptide--D-alanyl-D-alanine ligase